MNPRWEIEPVNARGGKEDQNGQNIYGQLENNNIIYMANDGDRVIRDYALLAPQAINHGIVRPKVQAVNFERKLVMFIYFKQCNNSIDCHHKILAFTLNYFWK